MTRSKEAILEERRHLKEEYREVYDNVVSLLFRHDPIGIKFETNTDEYEPEAGTILPRLRSCLSESDALRIIHEEFVHWFGAETAGPQERYVQISTEIWQLWRKFNAAE
jgi:hypothetical protein